MVDAARPPPPSPPPPADPPTIDPTNYSPTRRLRNSYNYDKSGGRRYYGSVDANYFLGGRTSYGRGRAEELPEGTTAGVRGRAPDHCSRGNREVTGWGERKRYRRGGSRRDWRRRALIPPLSPPVTPALSSSGHASARLLSSLLRAAAPSGNAGAQPHR